MLSSTWRRGIARLLQPPADLRAAHPQIDWRKLITFRDFLAYNYEVIGLRYVWDAVEDVSRLRDRGETA